MDKEEKIGGLNLLASLHGGPPLIRFVKKAASSKLPICPGDAVVEDISGQIESGSVATPGKSYYAGVSLNYGPPDTKTHHAVIVDPNAVYECASNEDDELLSTKHRGEYCNLELGVSKTRQSQHKLDAPSVSTNPDNDMLITGLSPFPPENDSWRVEVTINKLDIAAGSERSSRKTARRGRPPLFTSKEAFERTLQTAFGLAQADNAFQGSE